MHEMVIVVTGWLITGSSSSDGYSAPTKLKQNVHFIYLFYAMF